MPRLAQHFLKDRDILKKIAAAAEPSDGDLIIEIGPGHGELTTELRAANKKCRIIAVEKDPHLASALEKKFSSDSNITIINSDIRDLLKSKFAKQTTSIENCNLKIENSFYKIAGNIPYYLTGRLLRLIGELPRPPRLTVLTIQKEVAARLTPPPNRYNLLAASVAWWGIAETLFSIPRGQFSPSPKVDSAVIKISLRPQIGSPAEAERYFRLVRAAFTQPRQLLVNNLTRGLKLPKAEISKALSSLSLPPNSRPQNLNFELLLKLNSALSF